MAIFYLVKLIDLEEELYKRLLAQVSQHLATQLDLLLKSRDILVTGDGDARGDLIRLIKSNIPFANLFYTKQALDYMIWYQLQEAVNPGYLARMEARVRKENAADFWLPPSSVVATGGGFR